MMRQFAKVLIVTWLTLFVAALDAPVRAIEEAPRVIELGIQDQWKSRLHRFLAEFGEHDIEEILKETKVADISGIWESFIVFRLETPRHCSDDKSVCLTLVGRLTADAFIPEAMFPAGNRTNFGDVIYDIGGVRSWPLKFYSRDIVVTLLNTAKGLVVVPSKQTDPPL